MSFAVLGKRLVVFASFEFDLAALELKKNGVRLRLEAKPGNALACLLENAGLVVGREHLVKLLWPGESHGDFDHRLNKAISKLRFALRDSSIRQHFIQTVPCRGYRFVAEARRVEALSAPAPGAVLPGTSGPPVKLDLKDVLSEVARRYLKTALDACNGDKSRAAMMVGLTDYESLNEWLGRYGITRG